MQSLIYSINNFIAKVFIFEKIKIKYIMSSKYYNCLNFQIQFFKYNL